LRCIKPMRGSGGDALVFGSALAGVLDADQPPPRAPS